MSYQTIHDILQHLRQQFQEVARGLDAAEVFAKSEEAQAAVQAVREDEQRVADAFSDTSVDGKTEPAGDKTWLQFVPLEDVDGATADLLEACRTASTLDELEERKLEFDKAVEDFVTTLAEQAKAPSVSERLGSLAEYFASRGRQDAWSLRRT